jgi:hypothetical protein
VLNDMLRRCLIGQPLHNTWWPQGHVALGQVLACIQNECRNKCDTINFSSSKFRISFDWQMAL